MHRGPPQNHSKLTNYHIGHNYVVMDSAHKCATINIPN